MRKVLAVCNNPGSFNNVYPVGIELEQRGYSVKWIPEGFAVGELIERQKSFERTAFAEDLLCRYPDSVVLSGFSEGKGIEWQIDYYCQNKNLIVKVHDSREGFIFTDWKDENLWPGVICVNDTEGERILRLAWRDFSGRVAITGYPRFDALIITSVKTFREDVCRRLELREDKPIVLFAGTLIKAGETFLEVARVLSQGGFDCHFLPRRHPRWEKDASLEQKHYWDQAVEKYGSLMTDSRSVNDIVPLLAAADVVISDHSTALEEAATLQKIPIWVLYPGVMLEDYLKISGNIFQRPPAVEMGCAVMASDRAELINTLRG